MDWLPRHLLAVLGGLALLLAQALAAAPSALAHSSDPRLVTEVEQVAPALPNGVVVQARAGLAAQLVADNPTSTPLEVLATDGQPFLRLSAAGVEANVTSPDFFTTSSPEGAVAAVPDEAVPGAAPRWVQISAGSSWGWYDHRLHPTGLRAPGDADQEQRLSEWVVPLRYGGDAVEVRGAVRFSPLRGAFLVTADEVPLGLTAQALPGMLPGLFLSNPERLPLVVLGRDGEPFLRMGPQGIEVNVASRTHVEDRQARGAAVDAPSPTPRFELVDAAATSYTWLDARLRYPDELPPPRVLEASSPTVVDEWEVPLLLEDAPAALRGAVRWVPEPGQEPAQGQEPAAAAEPGAASGEGPGLVLPLALLLGALALIGVAVAALRRRTSAESRAAGGAGIGFPP